MISPSESAVRFDWIDCFQNHRQFERNTSKKIETILNWIKSDRKKTQLITAYSDGSKPEVGEGYVEGSLKKQCLPFYIVSVSLLSYSRGLRPGRYHTYDRTWAGNGSSSLVHRSIKTRIPQGGEMGVTLIQTQDIRPGKEHLHKLEWATCISKAHTLDFVWLLS